MAKTMNLQLSQNGVQQHYNAAGNQNGSVMNKSYRVIVVEDNTEVGDASFSLNINYYGDVSSSEYTAAQTALLAKIEAAIKAFDTALKA